MAKYSDIEIQTAKNLLEYGYKWIVRYEIGRLIALSEKPIKRDNIWVTTGNCVSVCRFVPIFHGIRSEDKEPVSLENIVHPLILDDAEKRYLASVIRPFRDRAIFVKKTYRDGFNNVAYEQIFIRVKSIATDIADIPFPFFKKGEMYKGMKLEREYTLEELGLKGL